MYIGSFVHFPIMMKMKFPGKNKARLNYVNLLFVLNKLVNFSIKLLKDTFLTINLVDIGKRALLLSTVVWKEDHVDIAPSLFLVYLIKLVFINRT